MCQCVFVSCLQLRVRSVATLRLPSVSRMCRCVEQWSWHLAWSLTASGLEGVHLPFLPRGGGTGLGTQWLSSPLAPESSRVTGTPSSKPLSWTIQWMEVYVDLSGIVHWCSSIGQSSLACTGLIRRRQKTHWSTNLKGHSPIVSMHHHTCRCTTMTHKPTKNHAHANVCKCMQKLFFLNSRQHRNNKAMLQIVVSVCVWNYRWTFTWSITLHRCAWCACTSAHTCLSQDNWPCNLFDIVSLEYPRCPSPVTWLPGNRNTVPLPFTFNAKCTSVFQLLQPMSTGAKGGGGGGRGKTEKDGNASSEGKRAIRGQLWGKTKLLNGQVF